MGLFKRAKKFVKRSARGFVMGTKRSLSGDIKGSLAGFNQAIALKTPLASLATKALGFTEVNGKLVKTQDLTDEENDRIRAEKNLFHQTAIDAAAKKAKEEEEKRRRRRGNIGTRPLGALVSNSLRTRVLTGQ